jgi:hypothetical protein
MRKSLITLLILPTIIYTQNETSSEKNEIIDEFQNQWRETMMDYESQYVYIIPVGYKKIATFYENVSEVPSRFRGAYFVDDTGKERVEFKITDPHKKILYHNTTFGSIFDFNVTEKGLYEISFNNKFTNSEIKPTFTMNSGQNLKLERQTLNKTESKLDDLIQFLQNYKTSDQMVRNMKRRRYNKLMKTNKYFFVFSVIETLVLVGVSAWQYYYMKHLFEIKGSL